MNRTRLNRRLILEEKQDVADGAGGFVTVWQALGTVWAALEPGPLREITSGPQVETLQQVQITVRAGETGDPSRPLAGQRLREGNRRYRIIGVTERDRRGLYLTCQTIEESET